ncbi:glycosyltransferase family 39 protein [Luteibacter sp. PPL201]|uniref:Glycosyltransferase family 39 protein n=1 Tax=Luteibacter sahnii TaxID=3021977 RepID=A0ABT6B8D5_9GAMM
MSHAARCFRWIAEHPWCLLLCWLVPACLLPPVPIDETRYLTIAWEMRQSGDLIGLTLNGQPYMDKTPLLFWLINASWALFGVATWAARLVDVAFAAGTVALLGALAGRVQDDGARRGAGWLLAPVLIFGTFGSVIMFDGALSFFVVLALYAVVVWLGRRDAVGPLLLFAAAALGLLSKGPVFFLHVLFPLALLPWWHRKPVDHPWQFALGVVAVMLLAAAPLAWWAYESAARFHGVPVLDTLARQSVGRVAESYAHRRPLYWYVPLLPLVLLPWPLWLRWRGVHVRDAMAAPLGRIGLAASVPAFVAFSLVSGKQVHYLIPLLPGVALFTTAMLRGPVSLLSPGRVAVAIVVIALAWMWPLATAAPLSASVYASAAWGLGALAVGGAVLRRFGRRDAQGHLVVTSSASTLLAVSLVLLVGTRLEAGLDPAGLAHLVGDLQRRGVPVAMTADEPGMIGYLARLPRPLPVTDDPMAWARQHPRGMLLLHATHGPRPAFVSPAIDLVDGWEGLATSASLTSRP